MRIETKGKHSGYVVQRDEVDENAKTRTVTYVVYKKAGSHIVQSVVKAVSRVEPASGNTPANLVPVSYSYSETIDDKTVQSQGEFGKKLKITRTDPATQKIIDTNTLDLPKNAVFSSLLTQSLADRFNVGISVTRVAFSEESGKFDDAVLKVRAVKSVDSEKVFQVQSLFMNENDEVFTFADGQPLGSRNAFEDTVVYLTSRREDAIGDFKDGNLKSAFGTVPRGLENPVAKSQGRIDGRELIRSFVAIKGGS